MILVWVYSHLEEIKEYEGRVWNPPAMKRPRFDPWVRKILWRRKWQLNPVFLPGKSHEQGGLESYSPQRQKESDTTERLTLYVYFYWIYLPRKFRDVTVKGEPK